MNRSREQDSSYHSLSGYYANVLGNTRVRTPSPDGGDNYQNQYMDEQLEPGQKPPKESREKANL